MMAQEHIRNIKLLGGISVTALADHNEEMRQQALQLTDSRAVAYHDMFQMTKEQECDAYIIATPNDTHIHQLLHLLKLRKPILVEKPLCTNLADCYRIMTAANEINVPVWVAMEYRFMPPLVALIERVANGEVGQPVMISIREHRFPFLEKVSDWNRFNIRTGGTLVEKCCHFWDLMRLVLKSNPVRVFASGAIDVNHRSERYQGKSPDIIDNAYVVLDFENGTRGMLDLCMFAEGSYWQETVSVTGSSARIDAMIPGPERFMPTGAARIPAIEISYRAGKKVIREDIPVDPHILHAGDHCGSTYYQHQQFRDLVKGKLAAPTVNLEDGSWAVAIGEAAERSVKTNQAVAIAYP